MLRQHPVSINKSMYLLMRRRNSNAGRDVQIFVNNNFEFIINRAIVSSSW